MKKKFSLLLVAVLMFSVVLTACGGNGADVGNDNNGEDTSTLQKIEDSGKIVLGTSADYPPFEFHAMIDGKDEIVGFDIEIAKYIAEELGVELVIQDMDFDKLLGGLSTGMLDIVIAGMNPDPERDANFTDIYYEANLSVLVPKARASEFTKVEDLDGKSIGAQIGTVQEEIARETIKDSDVKALATNSDIVMNLKTNKIDSALMETPVATSYAAVNDDLMVIEDFVIDSGTGGVSIAVKTGDDELTEKLNEILEDIKSQGLIEQWFIEANELVNNSI
ncbi:MAG: transporter substrate-binding domain-containing protein [Tissierella sp.]|nr:transporter substrate-binding domain-containing protein [Tissierella sp.]